MNYKEKMARAQQLIAEAKALLEQKEVSAEDSERAENLLKEAQKLKTDAARLKAIIDGVGDLPDELPQGGEQTPEGFKDFGDFVQALALEYKSNGRVIDPRLETFFDKSDEGAVSKAGRVPVAKDLSGNVGANGGFLIPQQAYTQLMAIAAPLSVVRQRATIIRMGSRQVAMPVLDQTGTEEGVGHYFGGILAFWEEEAQEIGKSEPKFRKTMLEAHELVAYAPIPNSLMDDAGVSLADFLQGPLGFPGAIAYAEDRAFLRGDGVGKPMGVLNAPATIVVTRATAGTIKYDDAVNMMAAHMGNNPVWVATHKAKATLMLMKGPDGNPSYLWGNATQGIPATFLGYPIQFVEKLPPVGTKGDLMLCDFIYYMVGDRQSTTVRFSQDYLFRNNQTAARAVHRVDGQPWLSAPITFEDGETQVSPFVVLGLAGS